MFATILNVKHEYPQSYTYCMDAAWYGLATWLTAMVENLLLEKTKCCSLKYCAFAEVNAAMAWLLRDEEKVCFCWKRPACILQAMFL
ncbi:hypothetical protein NPIL_162671 [Nephila pilipes]|uniref:Uncharacterized protein n=1 Tax=Nephila pilipes TaxID=299642 RepID=A0A8X6PCY9_NEPPI|nr:hypothetical protein NPIL_162671 [Nephila pilipes]